MKVFKLNPDAKNVLRGSMVTIGNFDGVHVGHQALIAYARLRAETQKLPLLVILFEPQPKEFFLEDQAPPRLYGLREKLWCLSKLNVDYVACIRFDTDFSAWSPERFFSFLLKNCHAKAVVIGPDFYFGQKRSGTPMAMQELARGANIPVEIYDFHHVNGKRVSSTLIRQLLIQGELAEAKYFLNQDYFILGRVVHGQQLARTLGVPTANIRLSQDRTALRGVFCVKIICCRQNETFFGVANLGYRPSVKGNTLNLEAHLFDFNQDLYGQFLQVFFVRKLRDERKFESVTALKRQMLQDLHAARNFFGCAI